MAHHHEMLTDIIVVHHRHNAAGISHAKCGGIMTFWITKLADISVGVSPNIAIMVFKIPQIWSSPWIWHWNGWIIKLMLKWLVPSEVIGKSMGIVIMDCSIIRPFYRSANVGLRLLKIQEIDRTIRIRYSYQPNTEWKWWSPLRILAVVKHWGFAEGMPSSCRFMQFDISSTEVGDATHQNSGNSEQIRNLAMDWIYLRLDPSCHASQMSSTKPMTCSYNCEKTWCCDPSKCRKLAVDQ